MKTDKIGLGILSLLIVAALLFGISACEHKTDHRDVLAVTIEPQRSLLEKIAGDGFDYVTLLPPSANPESYDPSTASLLALQKSPLYFRVGTMGFEEAALSKITENLPDLTIINTTKGVDYINNTHGAHGVDPHVWTSVRGARVMAANMLEGLIAYDPEHKDTYTANYITLDRNLQQLDSTISARLAAHRGESFLIKHPALSYFARDYGLNQIALEQDGKEPSAGQMKERIERAGKENVRVLFVEKGHDNHSLEKLAAEMNIPVVVISPLDYDWETNMMKIADAFDNNPTR